jgi:hypothetical protein
VKVSPKRHTEHHLSEQHFTEGDEMEDDLDDDNIDYIIIEEIERSRKAV